MNISFYRVPPPDSPAVAARRPGPFQNSSTRAARRAFAAVRSALESFDFLEAAKDIGAMLALALFLGVTSFGLVFSIFILFFVSL